MRHFFTAKHIITAILVVSLFTLTGLALAIGIPRGAIVFPRGTKGDGCVINGKWYAEGTVLTYQEDVPDGKGGVRKINGHMRCTQSGWEKQ